MFHLMAASPAAYMAASPAAYTSFPHYHSAIRRGGLGSLGKLQALILSIHRVVDVLAARRDHGHVRGR